jgi:hypothetical protein
MHTKSDGGEKETKDRGKIIYENLKALTRGFQCHDKNGATTGI